MSNDAPQIVLPESDVSADRNAILRLGLLIACFTLITAIGGSITGEKTSFLLKEALHLNATQSTYFKFFLSLPTYLQPCSAPGFRFSPGLRSHRRSYFALGVLFLILGNTLLASLHVYHVATIFSLLLITGSGSILMGIIFNSIFIIVGNRTGNYPRLSTLAQFLPLLLSMTYTSDLGGYVAEHWSYVRTYVTAGALYALLLLLLPLIEEVRAEPREDTSTAWEQEKQRRLQATMALKEALKSRSLWIFLGYIGWIALTPSPDTARLYYQNDILHFSKQLIGHLNIYGAAGALVGLALVALYSQRVEVRMLAWIYTLYNIATYLMFFFMRDALSAECIYFVNSAAGVFASIAFNTLVARACPRGAEALVFGLSASVNMFFYRICDTAGSELYDNFGPLNTAHHYTQAHGWYMSLGVGLVCGIAAFLFHPFMPAWMKSRQKITDPA